MEVACVCVWASVYCKGNGDTASPAYRKCTKHGHQRTSGTCVDGFMDGTYCFLRSVCIAVVLVGDGQRDNHRADKAQASLCLWVMFTLLSHFCVVIS